MPDPANASQILSGLIVAGLMGMVGQGVRSIAGIKKMNDDAQTANVASSEFFQTSRFVVSLLIGFIAGIAAAISLGNIQDLAVTIGDTKTLLGIAAAGYSGVDFIEAFGRSIVGKTPTNVQQRQLNTLTLKQQGDAAFSESLAEKQGASNLCTDRAWLSWQVAGVVDSWMIAANKLPKGASLNPDSKFSDKENRTAEPDFFHMCEDIVTPINAALGTANCKPFAWAPTMDWKRAHWNDKVGKFYSDVAGLIANRTGVSDV
jgi:hypothetical protein